MNITEPIQLHLIRHGEVETTAHRVFGGGRIDSALSDHGEWQARRLASYLRRVSYDAVFLSPMRRARSTAAPLLDGRGLSPVTLDGLREVDFGNWTGLRWEEVQERHGISAFDWLKHLAGPGFHGGEHERDVRGRVHAALEEIVSTSAGKTVAVVCHGGIVRMALSILTGLPMSALEIVEIDYASVTWVNCGERRESLHRNEVQLLNFAPWRDLDAPPEPEEQLPA